MTFRIDDLTVAVLPERFDVLAAGECGVCTDCTECTDDTSSVTACTTPNTGAGTTDAAACDASAECDQHATQKALRSQLDRALAALV